MCFSGFPYFGFFWINAISHDAMNGPSSMDQRILSKFEYLESQGVLNETMVVFLSDHGMRYGEIRNTFLGWYEERLPFAYIWIPQWYLVCFIYLKMKKVTCKFLLNLLFLLFFRYRQEDPQVYQSLTINQNRLTSPFDLYETLRDVLER